MIAKHSEFEPGLQQAQRVGERRQPLLLLLGDLREQRENLVSDRHVPEPVLALPGRRCRTSLLKNPECRPALTDWQPVPAHLGSPDKRRNCEAHGHFDEPAG